MRIFPLVALVEAAKFNEMIGASHLPEALEADSGPGPPAHGSRGQAIPVFGFVNA
jgi:hypothetical protein